MNDIIAAINQTNEQAFDAMKAPQASRDVIAAAVKRLVKIEIGKDYYPWAGVSIAPPPQVNTDVRRMPTASGMRGGGDEDDVSMVLGGAHRPTVRPSPTRQTVAPAGELSEAQDLSQRGTCPQYEVVHYSFEVVMPARYLLDLQRNLIERNLHTVLSLQISQEQGREDSKDYYYGPEPVVRVIVQGELLMLSAWTRGAWDPKTNQWSKEYPPLMPPEVLAALNEKSGGLALRPEDRRRLPAPVAGMGR